MDNEKKYKERTNAVIYWFRKQDFSSSKYAFNRCIQDLTQSDIIHCELYFVDRAYTVCITSNTSLTFYKGSKVEYKNRDIWEGYIVYLSEQQVRNLWNYCKKDKGREFDRFGLVFFYCLPCVTRAGNVKLICSKQVTEASMNAGIFRSDIFSDSYAPSDVLKEIKRMKNKKVFRIEKVEKWPLN